MDGTFNIAPPLFSQMYTIHARCMDQMIPLIYALLPDKRRATYDRMFAAINTMHDFGPRTIITDYEQAAIQACHAAYPAASQSGCFFHLTQCIQRKIQSIGLQNQYRNDYETFQYCRMLPALAFVPPADVIDAFETLADEMPDELTPLLETKSKRCSAHSTVPHSTLEYVSACAR
ncbi:uncharacterized protein LOC143025913 [Oratosquilla oratoria]|uniref:uncharacterized protein LOC143025913 n=1 Tax=Oratosquilla oratoria TaxID=337810 RepID=UPI003F774E7F